MFIDNRRGRSEVFATRVNGDATFPDSNTNGDGNQDHATPVVSRRSGSQWGVVTNFATATSNDAGIHLNRVSPK